MKPRMTCSVLAALIALGGCQSTKGGGSASGDPSGAYFDCVYAGYNAAVSASSSPGMEALDQAIKGCGDEAMAYAQKLAVDVGMSGRDRYKAALNFFKPSVEKETREQFTALINDAGTVK